jgi:ABC-type nitrate/sulfonate/bicarbonate transport system substrate-binding protein
MSIAAPLRLVSPASCSPPLLLKQWKNTDVRTILGGLPAARYQLFGGTNPAAVLYAKQDFIAANPNTIQELVNAFYKTLKWIATATTDEVVNTVPDEYFLGDREIYVKALKANLLVYSKTGLITRQGMNSALNMLATFDPELKGAKIDLQKTFDDRFVKKATVLLEDPNNADPAALGRTRLRVSTRRCSQRQASARPALPTGAPIQ